jgi:hypothetical protein
MQSDVRGSGRHKTLGFVILAGLLAVPLAFVLSTALHPDPPPEQKVWPRLTADQTLGLPSHGKDCLRPEDCEQPLGCLETEETGRGTCLHTQCETDAHCDPERYCRTFQTLGNGPHLRGCDLRQGARAEGEPCATGLGVNEVRCSPRLFCNRGWCGRPCDLSEPSDCPTGFFCQRGLDGPSCVPSCENQTCPEGFQCAREAGGISVCAHVRGGNCANTSCPEGSRCTFTDVRSTDAGVSLRMECVLPCGVGLSACPTGQFCLGSRCRHTCDPLRDGTCPPEERCVHRVDLGVSLCK